MQLAPLTNLLGGYVWARYWHFVAMLALVVLTLGHVFMVFAVDPYSLRSIITGGYDESKSPEARNARPFVNLRAPPVAETPRPGRSDRPPSRPPATRRRRSRQSEPPDSREAS